MQPLLLSNRGFRSAAVGLVVFFYKFGVLFIV